MTTPVTHKVSVKVPATSANLGAGFDAAGLALSYYDEIEFTLSSDPLNTSAQVIIHGEGEETLPRDESHLVVSTFRRACHELGLGQLGFIMEATNRIPQARGMGSSAEAIVAGIAAAYGFATGAPLDRDAVFELAARIEGHPDNVAPAVYGGLTASFTQDSPASSVHRAASGAADGGAGADDCPAEGDGAADECDISSAGTASGAQGCIANGGAAAAAPRFRTVNYRVDPAIAASVFIPDFELSTEKARAALPKEVPFADAVYDVSRVALLPAALNPSMLAGDDIEPTAANRLLFDALCDRLHQPYRLPLMQPSADLIATLRAEGFAAAVSGAGPCVLVLHYGDAAEWIDGAAAEALSSGHWRVLHLDVDREGVQIHRD